MSLNLKISFIRCKTLFFKFFKVTFENPPKKQATTKNVFAVNFDVKKITEKNEKKTHFVHWRSPEIVQKERLYR